MIPAEPSHTDLDELAAMIGRELAHLPAPRAPQSLMPRVMAAVATSRPAPRTWFTWPLAWQALSIAALVIFAAGVAWWLPTVQTATTTAMAATTGAVTTRVAGPVHGVQVAVSVMGSVWRGLFQPVVGMVFLLVVLLCSICAACGAALGRVALGGASHP